MLLEELKKPMLPACEGGTHWLLAPIFIFESISDDSELRSLRIENNLE